jgi:prevent-host-death family protein
MNNITRVPASKFRREMKKWLRYVEEHEMIVITQRNGPDLVCINENTYQNLVVLFQKLVDKRPESV